METAHLKLRFEIHLERSGGLLRLSQTRFWNGATAHNRKPTSEMDAVTLAPSAQNVFRWDTGERALCILFLRAFAGGDPTAFGLNGPLAEALREVLRMKHAKKKDASAAVEPTWIQKMFAGFTGAANDPRLAESLFARSGYRPVALGREWRGAAFAVFLDGSAKAEPCARYAELAGELERSAPLTELTLSVQVLVAPATACSVQEFQPLSADLVPVHGGQLVRLHIAPSRAAYLCVLWVTPNGEVQPVYPGQPGQWPTEEELSKAAKVNELTLPLWGPGDPRQPWKFKPEAGLETLVVLAREKRLTAEVCGKLRDALHHLPRLRRAPSPAPGPHLFDLRSFHPVPARLVFDGPVLADPVAERHAALARALGARCEAGQALSFLNAG